VEKTKACPTAKLSGGLIPTFQFTNNPGKPSAASIWLGVLAPLQPRRNLT
jgi:hypothetical protein